MTNHEPKEPDVVPLDDPNVPESLVPIPTTAKRVPEPIVAIRALINAHAETDEVARCHPHPGPIGFVPISLLDPLLQKLEAASVPAETRAVGALLDRLDELATWIDEAAPLDHLTPWLIRRDDVRRALDLIRASVPAEAPQDLIHRRIPHTFRALCGVDPVHGVHWTTDRDRVTCPACVVAAAPPPREPQSQEGHRPPAVHHMCSGASWCHHEQTLIDGAAQQDDYTCTTCGTKISTNVSEWAAKPLVTLPASQREPDPLALTVADVEQIIDGIEHFIMNDDPEVEKIWQPYVDKLEAFKAALRVPPPSLEGLRLGVEK